MQLRNGSMESIDYLHTPQNSKRFNKFRQMVQFILVLAIIAMAVMVIQLYLYIK